MTDPLERLKQLGMMVGMFSVAAVADPFSNETFWTVPKGVLGDLEVEWPPFQRLCLKSLIRTWIGSVQGAIATWSNEKESKLLRNIAC